MEAQVTFDYESQPPLGDAGFAQYPDFLYRWSPDWSSSVTAVISESNETSQIDGFPGSLSYTNEESLRFSLLPAIYHLDIPGVDIGVGIGLGYRRWNVTEIGSFEFTDLQVFDNRYVVDQLGPVAGGRVEYENRGFLLRYRAELMPTFRSSIDQEISISPLISERGRNAAESWGGYSFHHELTLHVGSYLVIGVDHAWDVLEIDLLGLAVEDNAYVFQTSASGIATAFFRGTASLSLPIGSSSLRIGGGINYESISDGPSGEQLSDSVNPVVLIGIGSASR